MELPFTTEDVIKAVGIHPLKVKNIYAYGSRIYGTSREGSDYDIIFVSSNLLEHEEKKLTVNGVLLNVHIITPDRFDAGLRNHDIMNLECIFAPEWAKMQEKAVFPLPLRVVGNSGSIDVPVSFQINIKKLVKNNLAQSYTSWQGGKMKINKYDFHRGLKSVFHSLRMLMFANQIAEYGKITDFSAANHLYSEIVDCDEIEWTYFREKYLPLKKELEDKLKSYVSTEQESNG